MIIRATTNYAIQIMVAIAKSDDVISSASISEQTGISQIYLKKIANSLKNAGLVFSQQGLRGGYSLTRAADDITAWEILCAVGSENWDYQKQDAPPQKGESENCSPLVRFMFEDMNELFRQHFEAISLAELVAMDKNDDRKSEGR